MPLIKNPPLDVLKIPLTPEQEVAYEVLPSNERFILADATGLGKTYAALSAYAALKEINPMRTMVVVCTKSGRTSWEKELRKHTGFSYEIFDAGNTEADSYTEQDLAKNDVHIFTYSVLTPRVTNSGEMKQEDARRRQVALDSGVPFKFVPFDVRPTYRHSYPNLLKKLFENHPVVLAIDEAHRIKNPTTPTTKVIRYMIKNADYAWGLTATPQLNHIEGLFHLFDAFLPGHLAASEEEFLTRYTTRVLKKIYGRKRAWTVTGFKRLDELKAKVAACILKRHRDLDVIWETHQSKLLEKEEELYLIAAKGLLGEDERDFAGRLPDLQLVTNNAVVGERQPNESTEFSTKELTILHLLTDILAKGEGAVVYCSLRLSLKRLLFVFSYASSQKIINPVNVWQITGDSSDEERLEVVRGLKAGDIIVMTDAGGESINLQAVNHVIFWDLPWSIGTVVQVIGRIARMDSVYKTFHVHVMESVSTIDTYKRALVDSNIDLINRILGGAATLPRRAKSYLTRDEIAKLRKSLLWRFKLWSKSKKAAKHG